mgnify:FL=1
MITMSCDEVMASDLDLQAAAATARAAEKQVSVDRQGWLPKLEAGFRRNTMMRFR